MEKKDRAGVDRRCGDDRRTNYDLDYFLRGGEEQRQWVDRRWRKERRRGWVRVGKWHSMDLCHGNRKPRGE